MNQFDRVILLILPSVNVALGVIGVVIGAPPFAMAATCGFAVAGNVAIFAASRLYARLGQ